MLNRNLGTEQQIDRLIPVTKWNDYYDYPTLNSLRWLIYNEQSNGFHEVVRRVGSRVMLKENAFFEWVEKQNSKKVG
jgi:hypothetical protein